MVSAGTVREVILVTEPRPEHYRWIAREVRWLKSHIDSAVHPSQQLDRAVETAVHNIIMRLRHLAEGEHHSHGNNKQNQHDCIAAVEEQGCNHVFRDTKSCVYCGWTPPKSVKSGKRPRVP